MATRLLVGKQRLYWYFRVLCALNWITQLLYVQISFFFFNFISTEKKSLLVVNTTSNPRILHTLKHLERFTLHDLKKNCHLISPTLQNLYRLFCLHLSFIIYYISYCLYAGLVQLQLISQVHYINNATSHNKYSHAIHTKLICIEHCCKWKEISDR